MKRISFVLSLFMALALTLCSCSNDDYINAIPGNSTLLISMKPAKLSGVGSPTMLKAMLHVSNLDDAGFDLSEDVFFFEDAQGNLGLCAKVKDEDDLEKTVKRLKCDVHHKRDYNFAALPNNWILGWSNQAALLMGPVVPAAQAEMMSLMAKYLGEDEDDGIKATPIYDKIDSINAPMSLVCQTSALPDQFVAPFTLGAPRDANPSDIYIAAEMKVANGRLHINGQTFSFKRNIEQALQQAHAIYRPIKGKYVKSMAKNDMIGMFLNVDGTRFIKLMQQNRGIQALLAGINSAIDMDNIIKGVNGDMTIIAPSLGSDNFQMTMAAQLKNADWLGDVDYWKQSVPQGGHIGDWGRDCYYYTDSKTTYFFGVTQDWQYMSGSSKEKALQSIKAAADPIDAKLQQDIKGQKLVLVINLAAVNGSKAQAVTGMLAPLFGKLNAIVYTLQ